MLKDAWFPAVRPEMFTSWFLAFFSCWWLSGSRVWDDPFQLDQRRSQKICNSVEMAWDRDQIYIYTYKLKGYLVRNSFGIHWLDDLEALMESKMLEETLQFIPLAGKKRRTHCPPWYIFLIPKLYIHWQMKKKPCHQFIAAHMGSTGKLLMRSGTNPENPRSWRTKKWTHFQLAFQLQMVDFLLQIVWGYHFTPCDSNKTLANRSYVQYKNI